MTQRALPVASGGTAVVAAGVLGVAWPWLLVASALYAVSLARSQRAAALALLTAPLVLSATAPLASIATLEAGLWLAIGVLATAPFFVRTGAGLPWRGAVLVVVALPLMLSPLLFLPWGPSIFFSDIATRAQIALVAAAGLILVSILQAIARRQAHET